MLLTTLLVATLAQSPELDPAAMRELAEAQRIYGKEIEYRKRRQTKGPKTCQAQCVEAQEMCQALCQAQGQKKCAKTCQPALDECMKGKCGDKKKGAAPKSR